MNAQYPAPPAWVRRGARVLVAAAALEPDDKGRRPYENVEGELVAVVTHVGDPFTGKRTGGPVWMRREGGGLEVTAPATALQHAPGAAVDERFVEQAPGT